MKAQLEAENEALRKSKRFISDRSGLDCLIYAAKSVRRKGAEQLSETPELANLKARMQEGRIIVCEPVVDWLKDDGTGFRPIPELKAQWLAVHKEFSELPNGLGLRYEVPPARVTSLEERVTFVLSRW
ncbi:hypothetical protein SLS53_001188 [Cytospora paraplurivora]|uniref:NadR/Ttd14 AAA domain-containing protein n=1 Tax=Cytospora paraplurivora TaxID=2898453 RepID=A0AAN9YKV6_9PEZI